MMKKGEVKKIFRRRNGTLAKNSESRCTSAPIPTKSKRQKTLQVEWQRLISNDKTCPRCGSTEEELNKAVIALKQSLTPLGIGVMLTKKQLSVSELKSAPLESNRILINNHPLEDYIGGSVGQSPCCDVCGPSECRTIKIGEQVYETIPSKIIIQAGLAAATQLVNTGNEESCCSGK